MVETKECPFCQKQNKAVATVCRYCYSTLNRMSSRDDTDRCKKIRVRRSARTTYLGDSFVPASCSLRTYSKFRQASEVREDYLAIKKERTESILVTSKQKACADERFVKLVQRIVGKKERTQEMVEGRSLKGIVAHMLDFLGDYSHGPPLLAVANHATVKSFTNFLITM